MQGTRLPIKDLLIEHPKVGMKIKRAPLSEAFIVILKTKKKRKRKENMIRN